MHKSKQTAAAWRIHPASGSLTAHYLDGDCGAGLHLTQKPVLHQLAVPCWDVRLLRFEQEMHLLPNPHLRGGARSAEPVLIGWTMIEL